MIHAASLLRIIFNIHYYLDSTPVLGLHLHDLNLNKRGPGNETVTNSCSCWANAGEFEDYCESTASAKNAVECERSEGKCHWGPEEIIPCAKAAAYVQNELATGDELGMSKLLATSPAYWPNGEIGPCAEAEHSASEARVRSRVASKALAKAFTEDGA